MLMLPLFYFQGSAQITFCQVFQRFGIIDSGSVKYSRYGSQFRLDSLNGFRRGRFIGELDRKISKLHIGSAEAVQVVPQFFVALRMRTSQQGQATSGSSGQGKSTLGGNSLAASCNQQQVIYAQTAAKPTLFGPL